MKLLVISDIHAFTTEGPKGAKPSYVQVGDPSPSSIIKGLEDFLDQNPDMVPDVVVCPGDLGDKADQAAIEYAWAFLNRLAEKSRLKMLVATVGNHDIHSRLEGQEFDTKGILQVLRPPFPLSLDPITQECESADLNFWARNFYIVIRENIRFVVLNTSAFHGHGAVGEVPECEHGRISSHTLASLKRAIESSNRKIADDGEQPIELNMLVCHHHMYKDGTVSDTDASSMKGAHALEELLKDSKYGRWFVVHGHRHRARLFQTGGSSTGPFILSAASFSATKDGDYDNQSPNQCHLIEVDHKTMDQEGLYPCGSIRTLTWQTSVGWIGENAKSGGLPPLTYFGFRGSEDIIAKAIDAAITKDDVGVPWSDLIAANSQLRYLDYTQLENLSTTLQKRYGIKMFFEDSLPFQCIRKKS